MPTYEQLMEFYLASLELTKAEDMDIHDWVTVHERYAAAKKAVDELVT